MDKVKFFLSKFFRYLKSFSESGTVGNFQATVTKKTIFKLMFLLKNCEGLAYNRLIDILVYDRMSFKNRFNVIYLLDSSVNNARCAVSVQTAEGFPLYSVIDLFESASWAEREVWDMFGVYFFGNNDFRRILCDYGFKGHPLRKEYPLSGYYELLYDEQYTLVSYFPVEFMQEYRKFEISGVWGPQESL